MAGVIHQLTELSTQRNRIAQARLAELRPLLADLWQWPADRPGDRMCPELAELLLLMPHIPGGLPPVQLVEDWLPAVPDGGDTATLLADLMCDALGVRDWRKVSGIGRYYNVPLMAVLTMLESGACTDKLFEVYDAA